MQYVDATAAVTGAVTDLGEQALLVFGAGIVLAGSVFLIRWGFSKAKRGLSGRI